MNIKTLVTGALLVLAVGGAVYVLTGGEGGSDEAAVAARETADALPADGVVVYYFHGSKRCMTCNKMEALAGEVIRERFSEHLRDGSVVFRAVNLETDATRHFITDFELANKAVVMVERRGGEEHAWRRLDAIWDKISDDEAYADYIAENLAACLESFPQDAS